MGLMNDIINAKRKAAGSAPIAAKGPRNQTTKRLSGRGGAITYGGRVRASGQRDAAPGILGAGLASKKKLRSKPFFGVSTGFGVNL
jgi:hypothetical protein